MKLLLSGTGQRYHVIVIAAPEDELTPVEDQNYWIRATPAGGCFPAINYANETVGVIRYSNTSTKTPTTPPNDIETICRDEPYASLVPLVEKTVKPAKNDCEPKRIILSYFRSLTICQSIIPTTMSLQSGGVTNPPFRTMIFPAGA